MRWLIFLFIISLSWPVDAQSQGPMKRAHKGSGGHVWGPAEVIDGETLYVAGMRVRLVGVLAPERKTQCRYQGVERPFDCGEFVAGYLRNELLKGAPVHCEIIGGDANRRIVARCFPVMKGKVLPLDISRQLILDGLARSDPRAVPDYQGFELTARLRRSGFWRCTTTAPASWNKLKTWCGGDPDRRPDASAN
jgi:endonuclease YncB( thermonuclease family)